MKKILPFGSESTSKEAKLQTPLISADTSLFVVFFALGALIIIYFNSIAGRPVEMDGYELTKRMLPIFFLMICYAIIVAGVPKFLLASWQAGDNCYYLGFLFTLVSLAFALYDFVESGENKALVVQDFGIALSTTIAGLLLRVLFSQARLDPDNIEVTSRMNLVTQSSQLRRQLNGAIQDINRLRRSVEQSVNDSVREQIKRIDQLSDEVQDQWKKVGDNASEAIGRVISDFTESTNSLRLATESAEKTLTKYTESIESSISRFEKQSVSINNLNEEISRLRKQSSVLLSFGEVLNDQFVDRMREYAKQIAAASSELEADGHALANVSSAFKEIVAELKGLKPAIQQLPEMLQNPVIDGHSMISSKWDEVAEQADQINENLIKNDDQFSASVESVQKAISNLAENAESASMSLVEQRKGLEHFNDSISKLIEQINDANARFSDNEGNTQEPSGTSRDIFGKILGRGKSNNS